MAVNLTCRKCNIMTSHYGDNDLLDALLNIRVSIGEKITPHNMSDGNRVNPAYFIEFGFGIVGQNNPMIFAP